MQFAVLVKVVPPADRIRYDAERRTVVREGEELLLNPFDQRAVRVALELKRPGETVSVISLGPPSARVPLAELLALGVDRVRLLTDPRFAGSDVLATSTALSQGLRTVGHDLVLAGAWTTDSETGEVGPEVAALLECGIASEAREVVRQDGPVPGVEVTCDTPVGWARCRLGIPAVVTVGEKIAKPLKLSPEARASIDPSRVEIVSATALGLDPERVGEAGSRTVVEAVEEAGPRRTPLRFADGTVEQRVDAAVTALLPFLRPAAPRDATPFGPASRLLAEDGEVMVLASDRYGELAVGALEAIAEVRRTLPGHWPSALWVGRPPSETSTYRLEGAGALAGYLVPGPAEPLGAAQAGRGVLSILDARPRAAAVLFPSEPFGREVAGDVAARRGLGLVGDAIGIVATESARLLWSKPSFGGHTIARISCRTQPALATVRPAAFAPPPEAAAVGGFGWRSFPVVREPARGQYIAEGRETDGFAAVARRPVLVVVGMGVGGPEGVAEVRSLVAPWDAGLVATRRVVDAGWMPRQLQVGLTGRQASPRLAVLLGVSGSPNHMIGWRRAPALLAVNRDPEAPVFHDASVGIVGSIEEVLPALVPRIARALGR